MGKIWSLFCLRNLLVLSLAVNVSLILRVLNDYGKEAHFSKSFPLSASPVSSLLSRSYQMSAQDDRDRIINLDHGDPTMYEKYWQEMGERTTIVIPGWQSLSYFSDISGLCWFLEPDLAKEIARVHRIVGNAVTQDRYIVVGTGSTQLYQAALYALSPANASEPINVVSAAPFYSSYPLITDCLKSRLYRWGGDAGSYKGTGPYIELVTSPNNPDGAVRNSVVNGSQGILIHDLAYYWPQYVPITAAADHDLMLFTVSKSTGHAGMRIGWALVKDREVAKKMTKYIEINTIGVSKDSQLRAAKVLKVVSDTCEEKQETSFFEHSYDMMAMRWKLFRDAVDNSGNFSVPNFPPQPCNFLGQIFQPQPAFAWLKCEDGAADCRSVLRGMNILTRSGEHFGFNETYVRISMLDRDDNFRLFVERISSFIR